MGSGADSGVMRRHQAAALLIAGLLVGVAGCGGVSDSGSDDPGVTSPTGQVTPDPREDTLSALDDKFDERFPKPLIQPDLVISGGPPPDGIPPIDSPKFQRVGDVDWLEDQEPVLSLTVEGETRAYPLRIMTWHEIVNDTVGGVPVAVTYCPLCNSGVAFEREADGRVFDFGTSGMLYADNLVMYDRQTESLWPQLTGEAAIGVLTGTKLKAIPMGTVSWKQFRDANPESLVLSRDTGHSRPYGSNPYVGYDHPKGRVYFALPLNPDKRLDLKERVIGVGEDDGAIAVVRRALADAEPLEVSVDGRDVVIWHRPGQSSALDAETVAGGFDVGTVGVFVPEAEGERLTFERTKGGFQDRETGSSWNVLGHAVKGPLKGTRLQEVTHLDTFWFAWVAFNPETDIVGPLAEGDDG